MFYGILHCNNIQNIKYLVIIETYFKFISKMQLNNADLQTNTISYVESSPVLSALEGNNGLFLRGLTVYSQATLTGVQGIFVYSWWSIYIIFVYLYFFCYNIFRGFGASIGNERSERACFGCIENVSFKEDKDFLFKLLFSFGYQVEYNTLTGNLYQKAVKR
jgi:hypothetical protein